MGAEFTSKGAETVDRWFDLRQLPILLSVLLVVIKSGIGTQGEVG